MKARIPRDLLVRREEFGGIVYVPSRDDFFAVDEDSYAFIRSFHKGTWVDVSSRTEAAVTTLAGLSVLETVDPTTSPQAYSGPSFIGAFKDIVTLAEPLVLNCFATAHCPLKCVYCHADDLMTPVRRASEDPAPDRALTNVATTARLVNSLVAVITGGDPLTRPLRTRHLIEALSGHKSLVLDTSGVAPMELINSLVPLLREHRVHVRVSLDSPDARVQQRLRPSVPAYARGLDSYNSALYTIRQCLDNDIPVTVQTVVSKETDTFDRLLPLRDFLLEIGVRHWVLHLAIEAGAARKAQARAKGPRGGILPQPSARANIWQVVRHTLQERLPIDIRVTDNANTPNSVLLLGSDGVLYTEGLAHRGKVSLFDPESGRPDLLSKLFFYIDKFGHARRYLNWNPDMFDQRNLEDLCIKLDFSRSLGDVGSVLVEQERKYRVNNIEEFTDSLAAKGYQCISDEVLEDQYFDTQNGDLGRNDFVLRIRRQGERTFFAEKGPRFRRGDGEYDRVEIEIPLGDPADLISFLGHRFGVTWHLVRRRQTYTAPESPTIAIDFLTNMGAFAELEGTSSALEAVASQLRGLGGQEVRNYKEIILEWCGLTGLPTGDVYGLDARGPLVRSPAYDGLEPGK